MDPHPLAQGGSRDYRNPCVQQAIGPDGDSIADEAARPNARTLIY
jgi:hypothetical protein